MLFAQPLVNQCFLLSADCIWKALIWGFKYMGGIFSKQEGLLDYLKKCISCLDSRIIDSF